MTTEELQELINYIDGTADKYSFDCFNDVSKKYEPRVFIRFEDVMNTISKFYELHISEEKERTAGPDYESMYNHCLDSLEEMRDQVRVLKDKNTYMHEKLVDREELLGKYAAALSTVEVMTGNKFDFLQKG